MLCTIRELTCAHLSSLVQFGENKVMSKRQQRMANKFSSNFTPSLIGEDDEDEEGITVPQNVALYSWL